MSKGERRFKTDKEMEDYFDSLSEEEFEALPLATEEEMPSGGKVTIVTPSKLADTLDKAGMTQFAMFVRERRRRRIWAIGTHGKGK